MYLETTHQVRSSCSAASAGSTLPTPTGSSVTSPTASTSPTGIPSDTTSLIMLKFVPLTLSFKQPSPTVLFCFRSNVDVISGSPPEPASCPFRPRPLFPLATRCPTPATTAPRYLTCRMTRPTSPLSKSSAAPTGRWTTLPHSQRAGKHDLFPPTDRSPTLLHVEEL